MSFASAPKPGAQCAKQGLTKTDKSLKFTCVKSGKRLVWSKGTPIKAIPTPTPSPTPTQTPTATPTPKPTATQTPSPTPTIRNLTFGNIAENIEDIPLNVYQKFQQFYDKNYQSNLKVNIYVGPNTKPNNTNPAPAFLIGSNLLRNFKQPETVNAVYYSFVDKELAKKIIQEKDGSNRWNYQFDYDWSCKDAFRCSVGAAGITSDWQGISHFGVSDPSVRVFRSQLNGENEIHEYVHVVWMHQLKTKFRDWTSLTFDWFSEGHATFLGRLGTATSSADYKSARIALFQNTSPDQNIKDFTTANVLRFYNSLIPGKVDLGMRQYVWTLGYSTIEALAAIGGIDSPMDLYMKTVEGKTFAQAFKEVYGVEWEIAAPILAEVVAKQYKTFWP